MNSSMYLMVNKYVGLKRVQRLGLSPHNKKVLLPFLLELGLSLRAKVFFPPQSMCATTS